MDRHSVAGGYVLKVSGILLPRLHFRRSWPDIGVQIIAETAQSLLGILFLPNRDPPREPIPTRRHLLSGLSQQTRMRQQFGGEFSLPGF